MSAELLAVYVVYFNPTDFPNKWVVRLHTISKEEGVQATEEYYVAHSIEEARDGLAEFAAELDMQIPCARLERSEQDDPVIVETWL